MQAYMSAHKQNTSLILNILKQTVTQETTKNVLDWAGEMAQPLKARITTKNIKMFRFILLHFADHNRDED